MSVTCDLLPTLYNQYLIDLLLLAKGSASVRGVISAAGHKAISLDSKTHIGHAISSMTRKMVVAGSEESCTSCLARSSVPEETTESEDFKFAKTFEPLSSVSFGSLLEVRQEDRKNVALYVYTLATLAVVYNDHDDDLASSVSKVLSRAQSEGTSEDDIMQAMGGILDDDILQLLEKVSQLTQAQREEARAEEQKAAGGSGGVEEILEKMKDSKIASIAEEISRDIDMSALNNIASGGGINFSDLTNANSPLGSIVGKVGSTIQKKMASGELNQADLMKEACAFLGAAGAGGASGGAGMGMSELFAMMNGGGGGDFARAFQKAATTTPVGRRASMQSRLKNKLAEKQAANKNP